MYEEKMNLEASNDNYKDGAERRRKLEKMMKIKYDRILKNNQQPNRINDSFLFQNHSEEIRQRLPRHLHELCYIEKEIWFGK